MYPRSYPHAKRLSVMIVVALILTPLLIGGSSGLQLTSTSEYNRYVHTNISSDRGNYTIIDKPIFPVIINNSQIQVGQKWTIIVPLQTGHNYHVYCYGSWVNTSSAAKTDYDIYVYDPQGTLESSHTEAAGLPEHLGTTSNDALFTPAQTGNYSFVIENDARQSLGAQQATFMIIENLETDRWYTAAIDGKDNRNEPGYYTTWAYEFVTNALNLELFIKVPDTLDMYEARLYLMNDAKSLSINSFPLPSEPGLYGSLTGSIGGYNFENEAYRGVAYASCEYMGQTMHLNYTSANNGTNLYQLVLIGEEGSGILNLMLKTKFGSLPFTAVTTPSRVNPNVPAVIGYTSNNASLRNAELTYTTNNWENSATLAMAISNQACNATIPGQPAGTEIQYRVDANDILENHLSATGNFTVKQQPTIDISIDAESVLIGENATVTGTVTPSDENSIVRVQFMSSSDTQTVDKKVNSDGTFTATYAPETAGDWAVTATSLESPTAWRTDSMQLIMTVNEPPIYVKYSLYIIIGLAVACGVSGAVWFLRFRKG